MGTDGSRARIGLEALNFFMADLQAGVGPFLGVFLQQRGWSTGPIGTVMTLGGIAGMAVTTPAGAFVDRTRHKRLAVAAFGCCTILASLLVLLSQTPVVIGASQVATAIAGAAIGPAVLGLTLGVVRQDGFARQNGRNQAFNHAGNLVCAGLSGLLGWWCGLWSIFILAAMFGVLAIASALLIPEAAIDHDAARGLDGTADGKERPDGLRTLLRNRPLVILAACLAFFHLGNGAMLPLYGLAVVGAGKANAAMFTASTVMVAQGVMVLAAVLGTRLATARGFWIVLLLSFLALPIRGLVAGNVITSWGVWPVQGLDGIGAGLQSVAVPGLVARMLDGTGRVTVGQGAVATVQGLGASLSPAIGAWAAQLFGYRVAFISLGCFALVSVALWIGFAATLRPVCSAVPRRTDTGRIAATAADARA